MSSTHARTTSPTSCRRASRPTESAMTRMASCGSMKQSGILSSWRSDDLRTAGTVGSVQDGKTDANAAHGRGSRDGTEGLQTEGVARLIAGGLIGRLRRRAERHPLGSGPVGERQVERLERHAGGLGEGAGPGLQVHPIAYAE